MKNLVKAFFAVAVMVCMIPATSFALAPYAQDFEGLTLTDPGALSGDGWLFWVNVSGAANYGYGGGAPNAVGNISDVVAGEGGPDQGAQSLVVYSDYANGDHATSSIETNVYQETTVVAEDVGQTWTFTFDGKLGNLEGATTALVFIKTLDPNNNWAQTNFITQDMTTAPTTWAGYSLDITIDAGLVGQVLQIGFSSTATNYEGAGVFYDNINFATDTVSVEAKSLSGVKALFE